MRSQASSRSPSASQRHGGPCSLTSLAPITPPQSGQRITSLIRTLPPRERALVLLRFGGDLSQSEIAQRLDISQSQASRLLAAALQKLRRAIETDVGRAA